MVVGYGRRQRIGQSFTEPGAVTMHTHQSDEGVFRSVLAEDIDWEPFASFPPSARLAVVVGHPSEPGPYVVRVKLPSGVKLMPHWHHEDRVYTVMSGTRHFHWAKSGDYVTQVTAAGPISLEYVDPADDPRTA
jgi:hypothetical protein